MRFDVSELKTLQECGRKWQLSSRNSFHLRPKVPSDALYFGTLWHECLATLYMGGDIEKVIEQAQREVLSSDKTMHKQITCMLRNYYNDVLKDDLDRYKVLDIEHGVSFYISTVPKDDGSGEIDEERSVKVVGSVDMVVEEKGTRTIYYFEHKTCARFRPDVYFILDEQPRTYFIDLINYVDKKNRKLAPGEEPYKVGGVFINEVKKMSTQLQYSRKLCKYDEYQVARFTDKLMLTAERLRRLADGEEVPCAAPSYLGCQMCDMAAICQTYQYGDIDLDELIEEFGEEYEVRKVDHLDEKAERRIEG